MMNKVDEETITTLPSRGAFFEVLSCGSKFGSHIE